jgi:hypothetical protein
MGEFAEMEFGIPFTTFLSSDCAQMPAPVLAHRAIDAQ